MGGPEGGPSSGGHRESPRGSRGIQRESQRGIPALEGTGNPRGGLGEPRVFRVSPWGVPGDPRMGSRGPAGGYRGFPEGFNGSWIRLGTGLRPVAWPRSFSPLEPSIYIFAGLENHEHGTYPLPHQA